MTGLAADSICKEHLTGPQHPEQPARFDAAVGALRGLDLVPLQPRLATHDELALCHARRYIQLAEREIFEGFHELSTGDTIVSPKSLDAALRSTGGALNAVDAIVEKRISNAISIGRPPGPSCHARARDGLLHLQHDSYRGAIRTTKAWHRARSDRRLGRPSRQRHPGYFLYRRLGVFLQHASIAVVSRELEPEPNAGRARAKA